MIFARHSIEFLLGVRQNTLRDQCACFCISQLDHCQHLSRYNAGNYSSAFFSKCLASQSLTAAVDKKAGLEGRRVFGVQNTSKRQEGEDLHSTIPSLPDFPYNTTLCFLFLYPLTSLKHAHHVQRGG